MKGFVINLVTVVMAYTAEVVLGFIYGFGLRRMVYDNVIDYRTANELVTNTNLWPTWFLHVVIYLDAIVKMGLIILPITLAIGIVVKKIRQKSLATA